MGAGVQKGEGSMDKNIQTELDQFDSSKHSGVIAFFNRSYVKSGIFDKSISKMIDTAFRLRE